jgi:pre-mRNA-splicing helicase BRR2
MKIDDTGSEELTIDSAVGATSAGGCGEIRDFIPSHGIDAFWLQRQVECIYNYFHVQQKAQEAMEVLSGSVVEEKGWEKRPLREIENNLMNLFDYK